MQALVTRMIASEPAALISQHDPATYKTQLCHYFEEGHCLFGAECTFAHDPAELQPFDPGRRTLHQVSSIGLCMSLIISLAALHPLVKPAAQACINCITTLSCVALMSQACASTWVPIVQTLH